MNLVVFAILTGLGVQEELAAVRKAIASGDYHGALNLVEAEANELTRLRGRAELFYQAGDPARAFKEAIAGLEIAPKQIDLVYHAASAAVWLEDGPEGAAHAQRLLDVARTMGDVDGRGWLEAGEKLESRATAIMERDCLLGQAVRRLRQIAVGGIVFWLLAIWSALILQGRSRRPVS